MVAIYSVPAGGPSSSAITASTLDSPIEFSVQMLIDWERNGFVSSGLNATYMDVTGDLMVGVKCFRGRDRPHPVLGKCGPGIMTFTLRNPNLLYSSENALSPLYGKVLAKTPVRWTTAYGHRFTGKARVFQNSRRGGVPTVEVEVQGSLADLLGVKISPPAVPSSSSDVVMDAIFDAAGFNGSRDFQSGQTTLSDWFVDDKDALQAAREVEEAERGFLGEEADGTVFFQNRVHRLLNEATASQVYGDIFNPPDSPNLSYGMYIDIKQLDSEPLIINDARATVEPLAADSPAVLWTLTGEVPALQPGETRTWIAKYPNAGAPDGAYVDSWTTPDNTDVTLSGGAVFADLTINVTKNAKTMVIEITNGYAGVANITLLRARGTPVLKGTPTAVRATDPVSSDPDLYGLRTYRIDSPWLPSTNIAQSFVDYIALSFGTLRRALRVPFRANISPWLFMMLADVTLSRRVTIIAAQPRTGLAFTQDFFVERIEDDYDVDHNRYLITLELSQVGVETDDPGGSIADVWIVGTSELGAHTYLDA